MSADRAELEVLHEATLRLLAEVGVLVGCEAARALLRRSGVRVTEEGRAHPEEAILRWALEVCPEGFRVEGRAAGTDHLIRSGAARMLSGGGSVRVHELDGSYTAGTWEHLRLFARLGDALANTHIQLNQIDPPATDHRYYLEIAHEMLRATVKPCCLQVASGRDVRAAAAIAAAVRGSEAEARLRPLFLTGTNAEPPLEIQDNAAEIVMAAAAHHLPCGLGDYAMMGTTAPRTIGGALVQGNAVQLTALLIAQLAAEGTPWYYTAPRGSVDLRTLSPIMADPQATRATRWGCRMGEYYRLPVWGLMNTDAKAPDVQASCQRTLALQMAVEDGCAVIQGAGSMMDQMMMSSFAQAVIDDDIWGYVLASNAPPDLGEEGLAFDAIREMAGKTGREDLGYALHEHTLRHIREGEWHPRVFRTESFAEWRDSGGGTLLDRARETAATLLADHRPLPLEPGVDREITRIIENARG